MRKKIRKIWIEKFKNNWLKLIIFTLLIIAMTYNYKNDFFNVVDLASFESYQADSESIVYNKIYYDKYFGKTKYGLILNNSDSNLKELLLNNQKVDNLNLTDYQSQIGLQGFIFSFANLKLHISFDTLQYICCFLVAAIFVIISYQIYKKYSKLLGIIFLITFFFSPWLIQFSRNLYWVEFTWFLPGLLGLLLSNNYSKKKIYVPLIFLSILLKCLCGYEYITTIMLFTISFFVIDFFRTKDKNEKKKIFKTTLIVGISCLLAFFAAITIHSYLRGNGNIKEGLISIYKEDIVRRTLDLPGSDAFDSTVLEKSIHATIFQTVNIYFNWSTEIILGISGVYFKVLIFTAIICLIYGFYKNYKDSKLDAIMLIGFCIITVSWYILGKSHSYVHIHMNYVLWYFGFIQVLLYINIKYIIRLIGNCIKGDKLLK